MVHVLIVSGDQVNSRMGGVGIRNWELAHALANQLDVTLAIPNETDLSSSKVALIEYDLQSGDLKMQAEAADVIVVNGAILHFHPYLAESGKPLAVDLYVPNLLESLVWKNRGDWKEWIPEYEEYLRVQTELLRAGDYFFCASEKQRDYWLGWLHALKRINPHVYRQDPTLRKLIDVVPFGIPEQLQINESRVLKGVVSGISSTDKVILWSGGIWDWLDPLTPIKAVHQLAKTHDDIRLYFMGTHHPDPIVSGMSMPEQAIELSKELGIYGKHVFFGEWTSYEDRGAYLQEADLAVIAHPNHIETHFSFRTRILDCIWAELPIVATNGDTMADWIDKYQLGNTVQPFDVEQMSKAIESLLYPAVNNEVEFGFSELREKLMWKNVVNPLMEYCREPYIAPDKGHYLTEAERIGRDKDAFLEEVIQNKDNHFEQTVQELRKEIELRNKVIQKFKENPFIRFLFWLRRLFTA